MTKTLRHITQVGFFIIVGLIALNHYLAEIGRSLPFIGESSLHAICPFGGVEAFFAFLKYDVLISKIHGSVFVLLGIILVLSVLFGPVVCSYICPLGSIQEWFGRIGKKVFGKKYNHMVPKKLDRVLRYMRYGVLIFTVYLTTNSLKLVFLEVDPYYALFNFWSDEATIGGIIVLILTLLSSLLIERPWCKYACPFGALVGLTNLFRVFGIKRVPSSCIICGKCNSVCPMNIEPMTCTTIRDHQCISCYECTSDVACPVAETLVVKASSVKEVLHEN